MHENIYLCILLSWRIKDDNPFYRSSERERAKEIQTSLIALTQRYRPPALERIYVGADGLLNVIAKMFRILLLKINWILNQGQAKNTVYKVTEVLLFLLFLIGTFLND